MQMILIILLLMINFVWWVLLFFALPGNWMMVICTGAKIIIGIMIWVIIAAAAFWD